MVGGITAKRHKTEERPRELVTRMAFMSLKNSKGAPDEDGEQMHPLAQEKARSNGWVVVGEHVLNWMGIF